MNDINKLIKNTKFIFYTFEEPKIKNVRCKTSVKKRLRKNIRISDDVEIKKEWLLFQ